LRAILARNPEDPDEDPYAGHCALMGRRSYNWQEPTMFLDFLKGLARNIAHSWKKDLSKGKGVAEQNGMCFGTAEKVVK
jgi:hypothetical protein